MLKQLLEKQKVFNQSLRILAVLSRRGTLNGLTHLMTTILAQLNVFLNRPSPSKSLQDLGDRWLGMMPPDGQHLFKVEKPTSDTVHTQIHLHCPLRGTGDVEACYKLMNYDRKLVDAVGGQLVVLESQANSGKSYCRLALRPKGADVSDLVPAHQQGG